MPDAAPIPVIIPADLWEPEPGEEAYLVGWLAQEGDRVEAGAVIAEIMVDKVTMEVEAPAAGRLVIRVPVDTPVAPGAVLAELHP